MKGVCLTLQGNIYLLPLFKIFKYSLTTESYKTQNEINKVKTNTNSNLYSERSYSASYLHFRTMNVNG